MKTLFIKTAKIQNIFNKLRSVLGGTLNVGSQEHILEIDNELGRGLIKGISFKGGISYLEFDIKFSKDFVIASNSPKNMPICFAYCSEGHVAHSFGIDGKRRNLENFQTGIFTSRTFEDNVLHFKKDISLKTTLIVVNSVTKQADNSTLNHTLQQLFFKETPSSNFVHVGSYNLKILEKIQQLDSVTEKGIIRNLLVEGLVHMILALEIQQHSQDLKTSSHSSGSLTRGEMASVEELSKFIQNHSEQNLSVSDLCRKGGLSPSKIQEGFKLMHGTTVTDYIREVRVRKAEDLIKNTDLNISEIVYSIGFTSRSYFSKIFKAKYNCSPKQYKDHKNTFARKWGDHAAA